MIETFGSSFLRHCVGSNPEYENNLKPIPNPYKISL